ncbi:AAA family ATPase [Nocardia terpenica]|uniref:AAA family ATPase n=1 Tax=Nocardia terpenica TaxID=455432 RepID=UPI002FE004B3
MPTRPPCSDRSDRLLVVEGMPGSGKTSAIEHLAAQGHQTLGEYISLTGDIIPLTEHPGVDDGDAHERNCLLKHRRALGLTAAGPVCLDRDWLSMLAYAHSLDNHHLLHARARWACAHLHSGHLAPADTYLVLHVDITTSLQRRTTRLTPGHPWSTEHGLTRLATFYTDPIQILEPVHARLAANLADARWLHLYDPSIETTTRELTALAVAARHTTEATQ